MHAFYHFPLDCQRFDELFNRYHDFLTLRFIWYNYSEPVWIEMKDRNNLIQEKLWSAFVGRLLFVNRENKALSFP